jgi:hypothetical protein
MRQTKLQWIQNQWQSTPNMLCIKNKPQTMDNVQHNIGIIGEKYCRPTIFHNALVFPRNPGTLIKMSELNSQQGLCTWTFVWHIYYSERFETKGFSTGALQLCFRIYHKKSLGESNVTHQSLAYINNLSCKNTKHHIKEHRYPLGRLMVYK